MPPPVPNVKDGRSFSLVAYRALDGNVWYSTFTTIAVDAKQKRVLFSMREPARDGLRLYAVPLESFVKGGLRLDDLTPLAGNKDTIGGIAVAP